MKKILINISDINVKDEEYIRLLGFPPDYILEGRSFELSDWAKKWYSENGKPWVYTFFSDEMDFSDNGLKINGVQFNSKKFRTQLLKAGADCAMIAAVSAGKELEEMSHRLWEEGKPDEYFFLEVFGSAVVEHLITNTGAQLCEWAENNNSVILPHYSPGYTGWNIKDQVQLFKLIKQNGEDNLPGELNIFETGMLNPKKSLLAVFGVTKNINYVQNTPELIPCISCSLKTCQYRRTEYKYSRNLIENVAQLSPNVGKIN